MLVGQRCLQCDHYWDNYNLTYNINECEECGSSEYTEVYEMICDDCTYEFEGSFGDECPDCGSCELTVN